MRLEDQVIPLPMAQRLKELGVKQESAMYDWATISPDILGETWCHEIVYEHHPMAKHCEVIASAFTLMEILKMLPGKMRNEEKRQWDYFRIYGGGDTFSVEYHTTFSAPLYKKQSKNLLTASCAMLIHLLESNLITVQEVNSRI